MLDSEGPEALDLILGEELLKYILVQGSRD
jgi:hypothetical protein